MKIPGRIHQQLFAILQESMRCKVEIGGLLLYDPSSDSVRDIIRPADVQECGQFYADQNRILFDEELYKRIQDFNARKVDQIDIGQKKYHCSDGVLIDYHTHPLPGQTITSSEEDTQYAIIGMGAGSELILSADALHYRIPGAFTFAHHIGADQSVLPPAVIEGRKKGLRSNFAYGTITDFVKLAKELSDETGIHKDAFLEAMQSERKNNLVVSFPFAYPDGARDARRSNLDFHT